MTKDELYDKLIAMLPVENKDDKELRVLLSDCFRTYKVILMILQKWKWKSRKRLLIFVRH